MIIKVSGLLIAAGLSGRMGEPKALLLQDKIPFAIIILKKMLTVCDRVVVVLGHSAEVIRRELQICIDSLNDLKSRINFVTNKQYERGMLSSLKCGLNEKMNAEWILYHFVDQPGLPKEFYQDFTEQIENKYDWIQPRYKNEKGHPVLLHSSIFKTILQLLDDSSLKEMSNKNSVRKKLWDCTYKEILQDIDYPSDLKQD